MRKVRYLVLILFLVQCKQRFDIPIDQAAQGYLVVEGYINTNGASSIQLSNTNKLSERHVLPVRGAIVQVLGDDNSVIPLLEQDSGRYLSESHILSNAVKYKLHIRTAENKEYGSDFLPVQTTPDIDMLTWTYDDNGIEISVNANDNQLANHYYKWQYEETWEFNAGFRASLTFRTQPGSGPVPSATLDYINSTQTTEESLFTCWKSNNSSEILTASTSKLSQNRIFVPLIRYPKGAWELSVLYSARVIQQTISKESYEFYERMKKNSENLGTIFDPLPSELSGNITCITNPKEPVVGNIDVSEAKEKRIFISNSQLPGWGYDQNCEESRRAVVNDPDSIQFAYQSHVLPTVPSKLSLAGTILYFYAAREQCVDCRLRGTNAKPSFWP